MTKRRKVEILDSGKRREIEVIFRAFFDKEDLFDPNKIKRGPDEEFKKGDPFSKSKGTVHDHYQFRYYMKRKFSDDISKIDDLENFFEENEKYLESLRDLKEAYILELYITLNEEMCGVTLSPKILHFLSKIDCCLVIDIYT